MNNKKILKTEQKKIFQDITKILVEYDERKNRIENYSNPELHYIRKAVTVTDPDLIRVELTETSAFTYRIVVAYSSEMAHFMTEWVHEDGIAQERVTHLSDPDHPVHAIACITDLYKACKA